MWKDEEPFELELFNNCFHNLHMKEMEKQIIHNFGEVTVYCFEEKKVRDPRTLKLTVIKSKNIHLTTIPHGFKRQSLAPNRFGVTFSNPLHGDYKTIHVYYLNKSHDSLKKVI